RARSRSTVVMRCAVTVPPSSAITPPGSAWKGRIAPAADLRVPEPARTEAAASTPREAATPTPCGAPASTRQAVAPIWEAPASTRQATAPRIESAEPTSAEPPPQTIPQLPQRNDREDPRVPGQGTPEALRRRGAARH